MSFAGPIDEPAPSPVPTPTPKVRRRVSRRTVLGVAVAGGGGVAAIRLLGLTDRLGRLLPGAQRAGSQTDWVSPLGSESAKVAHLLRRTTFGATSAELESSLSAGFSKTIDRLLETAPAAPPPIPGGTDPSRLSRLSAGQLQQWWSDHMLTTATPFAERLTLFWHGHFTSDYRKVGLQNPYVYWQNLTWRDMALTDLRSMLMRVTSDPAMLRYLDLATSTGKAPNENYSRELMELFTMGSGSFKEDDVRAASKALAGWVEPKPDRSVTVVLDAKNNVTRPYPVWDKPAVGAFDPRRAFAGGSFAFLGKTDRFDTQKVIDAILAQPATAPFIAGKVAQHFVSTRPDAGYVKGLGDTFRKSRYDVKTLLRAVFTSPEFLADQNYRALVKSPVEFMVHTLKALNAPQLSKLVAAGGSNMGQSLFDPPDVGGWPNNEAWISSNTVVARVNFVSTAIAALKTLPPASDAHSLHLDSTLSPPTAKLLSGATDDKTRWFLTLASPEFQLK